jgi:hypothetical protein
VGRGHRKKATVRFRESIQADIEETEHEATQKRTRKVRGSRAGPRTQSTRIVVSDDDDDEMYSEQSAETTDDEDEDANAVIDTSEVGSSPISTNPHLPAH